MPKSVIAIVGVGLIGGSLGMALRSRGLASRVVGVDLDTEAVRQATLLGAIDDGGADLAALAEADIVVFATPVGGVPALMERAEPFVKRNALVTDVGSVKTAISEAGERLFGFRFLGGHPMAGSETSGVAAANADLFVGAPWVLTPTRSAMPGEDDTLRKSRALVSALGARPVLLEPAEHDRLVALVSHLPHVLSFAYSRALSADSSGSAATNIAGPSYHDITRISRSSHELWADIFLENREEVVRAIREFEESIGQLRSAIEAGERETILEQLRDRKTT